MEKRYALRDDQWERLQGLGLPGCSGHVGVSAKDNRLFVEAVLYRFGAGIPWRDLPAGFGNWHTGIVFTCASTGGASKAAAPGHAVSDTAEGRASGKESLNTLHEMPTMSMP